MSSFKISFSTIMGLPVDLMSFKTFINKMMDLLLHLLSTAHKHIWETHC